MVAHNDSTKEIINQNWQDDVFGFILCLEALPKKSLRIEVMCDDNSCLFSAISYVMALAIFTNHFSIEIM